MRRLLKAGARADQTVSNNKGVLITPLAIAERTGYTDIAQLLREHNAVKGLVWLKSQCQAMLKSTAPGCTGPSKSYTRCTVKGLVSRHELNGRLVSVLGLDLASGRYIIEMTTEDGDPSQMLIKDENLGLVPGGL